VTGNTTSHRAANDGDQHDLLGRWNQLFAALSVSEALEAIEQDATERRLCACGHMVRVDLWIGHRLKCEHVER
jgi:hypothetical protein